MSVKGGIRFLRMTYFILALQVGSHGVEEDNSRTRFFLTTACACLVAIQTIYVGVESLVVLDDVEDVMKKWSRVDFEDASCAVISTATSRSSPAILSELQGVYILHLPKS